MATLTNPDTLTANSLNTFTAPAWYRRLMPSTTYWISVNEGITSNRATVARVSGWDETGEPGWSIGNDHLFRADESSSWSESINVLMIAIKGTALCDGIWCATLTVRDLGSSDRGCGNGSSGNECINYLSEDEFTHAMTDYSVTVARVQSDGQLRLNLSPDITSDSESLVLHVGSETFVFEDADVKQDNNRRWNGSAQLDYRRHDSIEADRYRYQHRQRDGPA